jgi:hypothetical protein
MKRPSRKLDHSFYGPYPVVERIGTQAYRLKLLQQAGSIRDVFHILLLEPYVSDVRTAPELPLPVEIDGKKEDELEEILQSGYRYGTLHNCVKYKRYSAEQSKWLPAENLAHAQDMVREFHASYPNQPKPVGWGMRSRPGAGSPDTNAARIYVIAARAPTLGYR